jgi:hypothetical protein
MENIKSLNNQLVSLFGIDTMTGRSIWRIVFSEDQFEKRLGTYDDFTESGIFIRTVTEVREVPKYRQWIQNKFVLERLVIVPEINRDELPISKLSYEPMFVFEDKRGNALPPKMEVCKIVIDTVYAAKGKQSLAKYKDPESNHENALELQKQRVDEIYEEVFGDETNVSDHLTRQTGIVVPGNYTKN